jgi:hypothetical protein
MGHCVDRLEMSQRSSYLLPRTCVSNLRIVCSDGISVDTKQIPLLGLSVQTQTRGNHQRNDMPAVEARAET